MVTVRGSAWHVALRRAAHQLYDHPPLVRDPFAVPLLGCAGAAQLARTPRTGHRAWSRSLRAFAAARSCLAEQCLATAVANSVHEYWLLGSGLDTFALRNPWPALRVIEVDRPEMILRKRALLREAGIAVPACLSQVACDLNTMPPTPDALAPARPACFAMLGVAPYLTHAAFQRVLAMVLSCGPGSGIVFDYRLPRAALNHEEQRQHDSLAARVQAAGEPFTAFWTPEEMDLCLKGFGHVEDLDAHALNAKFFTNRTDGLRVLGDAMRVVCAWV